MSYIALCMTKTLQVQACALKYQEVSVLYLLIGKPHCVLKTDHFDFMQ